MNHAASYEGQGRANLGNKARAIPNQALLPKKPHRSTAGASFLSLLHMFPDLYLYSIRSIVFRPYT